MSENIRLPNGQTHSSMAAEGIFVLEQQGRPAVADYIRALTGHMDKQDVEIARLRAENAALAERVKGAVSDEWRVRYYQLRGCIRTDPMMDGTNRILGVNIPLLNEIIENHRNNPVEEARDANH